MTRSVAAGQVWDVHVEVLGARVTVLVLSVGRRVSAVTIDSTHEEVWPTGEVIDCWEDRDFLNQRAERVV